MTLRRPAVKRAGLSGGAQRLPSAASRVALTRGGSGRPDVLAASRRDAAASNRDPGRGLAPSKSERWSCTLWAHPSPTLQWTHFFHRERYGAGPPSMCCSKISARHSVLEGLAPRRSTLETAKDGRIAVRLTHMSTRHDGHGGRCAARSSPPTSRCTAAPICPWNGPNFDADSAQAPKHP